MTDTTIHDETLLAGANDAGKSFSELAYDSILDKMLSGELRAGTLLQERAIAESLQISRTPVREALAKLESEGLITRHIGRLLIVREVSVRELMEILNVRLMLETEGIALAAVQISASVVARARALIEAQMTGPRPNASNHWGVDDFLHFSIADASGNSVLAGLVRDLRRRTRMFNLRRMPERFLPGCLEHLAIIQSLEDHDVQAARCAMATHLENTKNSILQKLAKI
jgi:DNA-binding GntR family transcriptional regulator